MNLNWIKCQGDVWCKLNSVNLAHAHFDFMDGVYIIWHGGENPRTVYVGKGNIRERLTFHRTNPAVQKYSHLELYVTWASVHTNSKDGVEAYLIQHLSPLECDLHPNFPPIQVNSPWYVEATK